MIVNADDTDDVYGIYWPKRCNFLIVYPPWSPKISKFIFGNLFQFTFMHNCYGPVMRIFNKISKVPFGYLRSPGCNSAVYVDHSYLQGAMYQSCLANILDNFWENLVLLSSQINQFWLQVKQLFFFGFLYHQSIWHCH